MFPPPPLHEKPSPRGAAEESGGAAVAPPKEAEKPAKKKAATKPAAEAEEKVDKLPPWNVVLLDDDQHSYEYVIEMLGRVLRHAPPTALKMAHEVDTRGRVIVFTSHREVAELKREQLVSYGSDPRIASCVGGMSAILEPGAA